MSKNKKKPKKSPTKLYSIRRGQRDYVESTLEEATALFDNVNEDTIRKLKQLKITLTEEIEVIKDLDRDIIEIIEDEEDLRVEIQESGLFKRKVYEILFDIEEKTKAEQKSFRDVPHHAI